MNLSPRRPFPPSRRLFSVSVLAAAALLVVPPPVSAKPKTFERTISALARDAGAPESAKMEVVESAQLLASNYATDAEEKLRRAFSAAPAESDQANLLAARGRILYFANRSDLALADYERALQLDPRCRPALVYRARLWVDAGQYDRALAVLYWHETKAGPEEQALAGLALFRRDPDPKQGLSVILQASNRTEERGYELLMALAERDVAKATEIYPEGYLKTAEEEFKAAAEMAPDREEPREGLERVARFRATGKPSPLPAPSATALAVVSRASSPASPPPGGPTAAPAADPLVAAQAAFQAGEYERAAAAGALARRARPQDDAVLRLLTQIHLAWANALAAQDQVKEARAQLGLAYGATPEAATRRQIESMVASMLDKMEAAVRAKDYARALAFADAELAVDPYQQRAQLARSAVYAGRADEPEHVRAYTFAIEHYRAEGARITLEQLVTARRLLISGCLLTLRQRLIRREPVDAELKQWAAVLGEMARSKYAVASDHRDLSTILFLQRNWESAEREMLAAVVVADAEAKSDLADQKTALHQQIAEAQYAKTYFPEFLRWRNEFVTLSNRWIDGHLEARSPEFEKALPPALVTRLAQLRTQAAAVAAKTKQRRDLETEAQRQKKILGSTAEDMDRRESAQKQLPVLGGRHEALGRELELDAAHYRDKVTAFWF